MGGWVVYLGIEFVGKGEVACLLRDEGPGGPEEGEGGADLLLVEELKRVGGWVDG